MPSEKVWVPVVSSRLAAYSYDAETRVLDVEFTNGARGAYDEVTEEDANGLSTAASPGRYLNKVIIPRYTYYPA